MTLPPIEPSRLDRLRDLREFIDREISIELGHTTTGIVDQVAELYGVAPTAILGRSRTRSIVRARHAAIWLMYGHGKSFRDIGDALGIDHTSAVYAYHKVDRDLPVRALLLTQLDNLERTGS